MHNYASFKTFPPKSFSEFMRSLRLLPTYSRLSRSQENISSQMIKSAFLTSLANALCARMLQVESSMTGIGILNLECAVLPPCKFCAANP